MKYSDNPAPDQQIEFVTLTASDQGFCIDITMIREIRRWTPVTSIPHAEPDILGVMNLRGAVIPIFDLAARLGIGKAECNNRNVVVVVAVGTRIVGMLVDSVSEILTVGSDKIRPNPAQRREGAPEEIAGLLSIEGEMLRVLDLQVLFAEAKSDAA